MENKNRDLNLYSIFSKDSIKNKQFYNIGAGTFRHPFWTNIDHISGWYGEAQKNSDFINFNLFSLKKLPIPDNTAEIVYCSHTVEHITDEAAQNMFNESFRILKNKGIFRITTPNIDLEYRAYKDNDKNYFYWYYEYQSETYRHIKCKIVTKDTSVQQMFLYHFAAQVSELHMDSPLPKISDEELDKIFSTLDYEDALNYFTSKCSVDIQKKYPGNHINWWNEKKAFRMLKEAGFEDIYKSGYGQSFSPVLRNTSLFDNTHPKISLYIEAIK